MAQKTILTCLGSSGDTFPFIGLGVALAARGRDVVILANEHFGPQIEAAGLRFRPVGTEAEYLAAVADPAIWDPKSGYKAVFRHITGALRPMYVALEEEFEAGRSIVVAHWIDFASRVFQDRRGAPVLTVLLQPLMVRTVEETPTWRIGTDYNRLPRWGKRALFWAVDRWLVDPVVAPPVNALRASVGLAPVQRPMDKWMFSPVLSLGLWPAWFAPPQPDWPMSLQLADFPLFDATEPVPPDVDDFLGRGEAPIVFTPGTAMRDPRSFFEAAVAACERLGRRGLLLSRFGTPPDELPSSMAFARFAPLSQILSRCSALVHHGGIGTTAAGLAAGVPQLVTPLSHDQPDHALRLKRLGVGDWLLPRDVCGTSLETRLGRLLGDPSIRHRCKELAAREHPGDGIARAVRLIDTIAA